MLQLEQKLENQRVEHWSLIYTTVVLCLTRNSYVVLDGKRRKVYPTGNPDEPWTTNINLAKLS